MAQKPPDPDVAYVFPPGVPRGTTATVQLAGFEWTPDLEFFVLDPRIEFEIDGPPGRLLMPEPPFPVGIKAYRPPALPREVTARLKIPADFPPGPVRWQVANANGASGTGVFIVSDDPEIVESRSGNEPQRLDRLPITVSGRLAKYEEVDRYWIETPRNTIITCDLWARRLGSNFHGMMELRDAQGRLLTDTVDTLGTDRPMTFLAEAGKRYRISVRDFNFRGNRAFVYRLRVTTGPRVVAAIPAFGQRGTNRDVEFVGYGLKTGKAMLEQVTQRIAFPADPAIEKIDCRISSADGPTTTWSLGLSDLPETVESRATASAPNPTLVTLPIAVTGKLDRTAPRNRYRFDGKRGDIWNIAVQAQRIDSPLDVSLAILGADGKELIANDDLPGTTDVGLEFTVPADGAYDIVVTDLSGAPPSPLARYRLVAQRAAPDFSLQMPQHLNVPLGEKVELAVKAQRTGGLRGPIELAFNGLPEGISAPAGLVIPFDQSELKIPLECSADAATGAALVTLTGRAQVADLQTLSRNAQATASGNLAARTPEENSVSRMLVAVTMKPVAKIRPFETDERTVHRGTMHLAELSIERLGGFEGDVVVQMDSKQGAKFRQGIIGPDVLVPASQDRVFYPCFVPEVAETVDAYRFLLVAAAQVRDPKGKLRVLLSKMQTDDASVAITVEGALLKISSSATEATRHPGETVLIPLKIARSPKLREPVRLEVRIPDEWANQISADPMLVRAEQEEATIPLRIATETDITGKHTVTIRAIAIQPGTPPAILEGYGTSPMDAEAVALLKSGRLPVIAEIRVPLVIQAR